MKNREIAKMISDMGKMMFVLDYDSEQVDKFLYAGRYLGTLSEELSDMCNRDGLASLTDISSEVIEVLKERIKTGVIKEYSSLSATVPEGMIELFDIPGFDKNFILQIYRELNISDINTLERAVRRGELLGLEGFDKDKTRFLLDGIKIFRSEKRIKPIDRACDIAIELVDHLKNCAEIINIEIVGDLRRRKDLFDTVELLAATNNPAGAIEHFIQSSAITEYEIKDNHLCCAISRTNLNVLFRTINPENFASALFHHTGSNAFLDSFYKKIQELKSNQVVIGKNGIEKQFQTERELFKFFDLDYIPPVLREDRGEISEAYDFTLPNLISKTDIKGDLHVHSVYSDGKNSITLLADRAKKMGYEYIGIADHSQSLTVANGLTVRKIKEKLKQIKTINKEYQDFRVLCGTEVDILSDGSLDYPEKILKMFDYVIGSIHVDLTMSYDAMSERILTAIRSGKIDILGHPTGRLFGARKSLDFDLDQVMKACVEHNVAMEVSGYVNRLDLNDQNIIKAKEYGVKFAIGTDAHYIDCLESMKYGVWQAQRGWLTRNDVINALTLEDFLAFIKNRK